ncbi:MAG: homocysteine S-methyltransferase family protein [Verrucomicrobia bacterium]|nr:homocysteine S-methyltransferase family protein [Verrucomicrobiota bacterium]MBI3867006.1 homocysteine S-methyltransferase family protein [Verrucomicrobiota bacterium]
MSENIRRQMQAGPVLGDGGYLIELERRGYVASGSRREKVGTGKGSGQFTPEVAIEQPEALRQLHREFMRAGSQALQALTFFGTREKLNRAGYGAQTESINAAAVKLAKEIAGDEALVAGSVSRTQLIEREGIGALEKAKDHIAEQIRLLKDAGVDFLILETFFHLAEMRVALECAAKSGLPSVATMSFRPLITECSDGKSPAECARVMTDLGAVAVGANCEQEPSRMLPLLRAMRAGTALPLAAQPSAFHTTDACQCFTRLPQFPDDLETIQVSRTEFFDFGRAARNEGIGYIGGCCGCNAAYILALADGLAAAAAPNSHAT